MTIYSLAGNVPFWLILIIISNSVIATKKIQIILLESDILTAVCHKGLKGGEQ